MRAGPKGRCASPATGQRCPGGGLVRLRGRAPPGVAPGTRSTASVPAAPACPHWPPAGPVAPRNGSMPTAAACAAPSLSVRPGAPRRTLAAPSARLRGDRRSAPALQRPQLAAPLARRPGSWARSPSGRLVLSHEALDAHRPRRGADYLRHLLVANGVLAGRDDAVVRLETWAAESLESVADRASAGLLRSYATWRVLRRARRRAEAGGGATHPNAPRQGLPEGRRRFPRLPGRPPARPGRLHPRRRRRLARRRAAQRAERPGLPRLGCGPQAHRALRRRRSHAPGRHCR